jgi:predicted acetyltransferase
MKKIIRLTESDLIRLVKRVINEKKFTNQSEVDRILDKISSEGMSSLTPEEKYILQNPDKPIEVEPEVDEPETTDMEPNDFNKLYEKVKNGLTYFIEKLPLDWDKINRSSRKKETIEKLLNLLDKIGASIDIMEDMDSESYEVDECKKLFYEAKTLVNEFFDEGEE